MTVKRRPVKKKAFRTMFAKVANRKKRQRAATAATADMEADVPNLGVARALVVILLIHVVAIAGIFFHSRWLDHEAPSTAVAEVEPAAEPVVEQAAREDESMPRIQSGDSIYTVGTGDTYENIASRFGVSETELRKANDNIAIRPGRYLRVPPKTVTAVEPAEITALRGLPVEEAPAPAPAREAVPAPLPEVVVEEPAAPALVETSAAQRADAGEAAVAAGGSSYVVKSGDTFWSIARRHGCSVDAVMKANGIKDPRKLRIGMNLTIP